MDADTHFQIMAEGIKQEKIRRAVLAGPSCVTSEATVAELNLDGSMTVAHRTESFRRFREDAGRTEGTRSPPPARRPAAPTRGSLTKATRDPTECGVSAPPETQ